MSTRWGHLKSAPELRTRWKSALLQPVPQSQPVPTPQLPHDKVRTIIFSLRLTTLAILAASSSLCLGVLKRMAPQRSSRWKSTLLQPVPQSEPVPAPELPDDMVSIIIYWLPLTKLAKLAASSRLCLRVLKWRFQDVDWLRGYRPRSRCTCALSLQQLLWISTLVRRFCRGLSLETGEPLDSMKERARYHHAEVTSVRQGVLKFNVDNTSWNDKPVPGDGRCGVFTSSVFHCGSRVRASMRLYWKDRNTNADRALNFELRCVGGDGKAFLEVHPVNWAWGMDDEMLQTLFSLLLAPEDLLALVGEGHAVPSGPPPPPVHLHLCPVCTSAKAWPHAVNDGVKVRWDQPFNLFHPEPLFPTCTCWDLHTRDVSWWVSRPDIPIPPCYGPY
eukprot:jgi/Botrbrau1/23657/Bobra.55_2s0040.1